MPSNSIPITPRYVKGASVKITGAQTDQSGATATNIVTLYTAQATGSPPSDGQGCTVEDIVVRVPVTSAAAIVNVFRKVSGTRHLIKSVAVTAVTVSTTASGFDSGTIVLGVYLSPGDTIDVASTIAQETHVSANIGEY